MHREKMTLLWRELRKRLAITAAAVLITAAACFTFVEKIRLLLMRPAGGLEMKIIYITPAEALLANLRLSFTAAALIMLPLILYQSVALLAVANRRLKKSAFLLVLSMYLLFISGLSFNYFVVFPFVLNFLVGYSAPDLEAEFSVASYISFAVTFMFSFGLVFQLPVVFWFLGRIGLVTTSFLRRNRKYALLFFVTIAALLTPPDVFSQILMAVPLLLLYELGIFLVYLVQRKPVRRDAAQTSAD
jgi:sec-independent protein translocase protein TatC